MPRTKIGNVTVKSNGFALWKKLEAEQGKVTLEEISDATGLNISTVRTFVAELRMDVGTSTIQTAALFAKYFGVSLDELLIWDVGESQQPSKQKTKG